MSAKPGEGLSRFLSGPGPVVERFYSPYARARAVKRRTVSGGGPRHRPDQAPSHHGRAVGGASASRNRRFESVPLQGESLQTFGS
jgi:hypothetical protein